MAVHYSNSVTARLEGFARARGIDDFGVLASRDNSAGLYFVSRLGGRVLSRWISLGWNRQEAEAAIERLAAGNDLSPSATGYTATVS